MRRRISNLTGFGNPSPEMLPNKGKLPKKFAKDVLEKYFQKFDGFDFKVSKDEVSVGIEPSYQYDPLFVVTIAKNKKNSKITRGYAFGGYGSGVRSSTKTYGEYTYKGKFVKFVDHWHQVLFGKKAAR